MSRTRPGIETPDQDFVGAIEEYLARQSEAPPHHRDGRRVKRRDVQVGMEPFVAHLRGSLPAPEGVTVVLADASCKRVGPHLVAGMSWQLKSPRRTYKPRTVSRTRFPGHSATAEVLAVIYALQEAVKRGFRHVMIVTDNQNVAHYLAGTWSTDPDSHTWGTRIELEQLATAFDSVQVNWVRTKHGLREVDRMARSAMNKRLASLSRLDEDHVRAVEEKMQDLATRTSVGGRVRYNGFAATVNPPSCTCKGWLYWTARPLRRNPKARAKPCIHVAAAARDVGMTAGELIVCLREHFMREKHGVNSIPSH